MYITASAVFHIFFLVFGVDAHQGTHTKEDLIEVAKLALAIGRYGELRDYGNEIISSGQVSYLEFHYFLWSYNGPLSVHLQAWSALSEKLKTEENSDKKELLLKYKTKEETEMDSLYNDVKDWLTDTKSKNTEINAIIYILKFKLDFHTYPLKYKVNDEASLTGVKNELEADSAEALSLSKAHIQELNTEVVKELVDFFYYNNQVEKAIELLTVAISNAGTPNSQKEKEYLYYLNEYLLLAKEPASRADLIGMVNLVLDIHRCEIQEYITRALRFPVEMTVNIAQFALLPYSCYYGVHIRVLTGLSKLEEKEGDPQRKPIIEAYKKQEVMNMNRNFHQASLAISDFDGKSNDIRVKIFGLSSMAEIEGLKRTYLTGTAQSNAESQAIGIYLEALKKSKEKNSFGEENLSPIDFQRIHIVLDFCELYASSNLYDKAFEALDKAIAEADAYLQNNPGPKDGKEKLANYRKELEEERRKKYESSR